MAVTPGTPEMVERIVGELPALLTVIQQPVHCLPVGTAGAARAVRTISDVLSGWEPACSGRD
jgi:hypothetical protein